MTEIATILSPSLLRINEITNRTPQKVNFISQLDFGLCYTFPVWKRHKKKIKNKRKMGKNWGELLLLLLD